MQVERMSPVDTAWLRMDGPVNAMVIVGVVSTATPVARADLRRLVEQRLLCHPRFRRRVQVDERGASWIDDGRFDLRGHLVEEALPGRADARELQRLAARLAGTALDPARPLWQLHFVPRYRKGSAWILRLHHCYADGVSLLHVLMGLTDAAPDVSRSVTPPRSPGTRHPDGARHGPASLMDWVARLAQSADGFVEAALREGMRVFESGVHQWLHPEAAAAIALQASGMFAEFTHLVALPDETHSALRAPLTGEKRVAWSRPIALAEVKAISRALGCTVNDVLLATVAGALGSHLRDDCGQRGRALALRASVPVNLRRDAADAALGNKFGLLFVDLPAGIEAPLRRVRAVHEAMRSLKQSQQPALTLAMLGLLGAMPDVVQGAVIELFSRKGSLVASNLPGPQETRYLCGQRIDSIHFWVPQTGSIGVGVSLLSYAGRVYCGVIADKACLPQPQRVAARIAPEFSRLARASRTATGRRSRAARLATPAD